MIKVIVNKRHKIWGNVRKQQQSSKNKRGICSFQCNQSVWQRYREIILEKYGTYKQSKHLESMIIKFIEQEENKKRVNT